MHPQTQIQPCCSQMKASKIYLIVSGFSGRVHKEEDLWSECQTSRQQRAQQKSVVEPPNRPLRPPLANNLANLSLKEAGVDPRARNRRKRKRQLLNPQDQSDLVDALRVQWKRSQKRMTNQPLQRRARRNQANDGSFSVSLRTITAVVSEKTRHENCYLIYLYTPTLHMVFSMLDTHVLNLRCNSKPTSYMRFRRLYLNTS